MALALNGILGVQIWRYWGKGGIYDTEDYELAEQGGERVKSEKISVYLGGFNTNDGGVKSNGVENTAKSPTGSARIRLGTPPQRTRKVD